jgi:hypothetical protein
MHPQLSSLPDHEVTRLRVTNEVFQKLAFTSFVIWTGGCLILFILFAAPSPNPIFPAMLSMTTPLLPAALVWLLYRPLITWRLARQTRDDSAGAPPDLLV